MYLYFFILKIPGSTTEILLFLILKLLTNNDLVSFDVTINLLIKYRYFFSNFKNLF